MMDDFCVVWFMKWLTFWILQLQQLFIHNTENVGRSLLRHFWLKEAQRRDDEKEQRRQPSTKKRESKDSPKKGQEEMEDEEEEE